MTTRFSRLLSEERGLWFTGFAGLTAAVVYACSGNDADPSTSESSAGAAAVSSTAGAAGSTVSAGHAAAAPPAAGSAGSPTSPADAAPPAASSANTAAPSGTSTTPVSDAGAARPADAAAPPADAGVPPQTQQSDAGTSEKPSDPSACERGEGTASNTSAVVDAAKALLAALTPDQQKAIAYEKTLANAQKWSNLPTSFVPRNGVKLGDLSSEAQKAAIALVTAAAGGTGATLFDEVREADEWLVSDGQAGTTDYGRGLYYFAIHGTPGASTAWMLQIAGHHLAYNFTYAGKCTSATPLFDGVEPMKWTSPDGTEHAPLEAQRAGMVALLTSVAAKPEAKLAGTFADLIAGPVGGGPPGLGGFPGMGGMSSGGDTNYPSGLDYPTGSTGRGVLVSTLSDEQKALVKTAIEAWVKNVADPVSSALLASYESEEAFKQTYIGYSGSPDLTTQASYARIDGPRVWIEFTVQGGIIYRDKVHYHTIWRDKKADYGADYASR